MTSERVADKPCPMCNGLLRDQRATVPFVIKDRVVVVKNVPAEVCEECGEAFLSGSVTDAVTQLVRTANQAGAELTVLSLESATLTTAG